MPNLLKYLYDINPTRPMTETDHAAIAAIGIDSTTTPGTQYLTLTYRQNGALDSDVTVSLQESSDLESWTTVTPDIDKQVGTDSTTGDPVIEIGVKITSGSEEYLRLNVTSP